MELIRSYILEVEVNDKCYVNFVSVNMEKNALRSALQWRNLKFLEISYWCIFDDEKLIGKIVQPIIKQVYQYCFIHMLEFCSLFWSFYCVSVHKKKERRMNFLPYTWYNLMALTLTYLHSNQKWTNLFQFFL